MHRRDFFKKAGAGVAVAAIAPLALADVPHGTIPAPAAPEDVDAAWIELMWREEPPQYGTVNSLADDEMRRIQLEAAERIVNTPVFGKSLLRPHVRKREVVHPPWFTK